MNGYASIIKNADRVWELSLGLSGETDAVRSPTAS